MRGRDAPRPSPDLAACRALLLRDRDGDGFPDALAGPVWVADGGGADDVDAAVAAAAELLAALAARALTLPIEVRSWARREPAVYLGPGAPPDPGARPAPGAPPAPGALPGTPTLTRVGDGLLIAAPDGAGLRAIVGAWLAAAAAGGGAGPADAPATGGFAPGGGTPAALEVALRHALASVRAPAPLIVPFADAALRTAVDPALPAGGWALRRRPGPAGGPAWELAGHDREALASACGWYARSYPRLPDGIWLDDFEAAATRFVRAERRDGRLAAAAAAARRAAAEGARPVAALLPYPPADAARRLGLPVANSARDGALRRWSLRAPWEGERLRDAAVDAFAALPPGPAPSLVEAYASEGLEVRGGIAAALRAVAAAAGHPAVDVVVRHAYRPALHWLVEEVGPALPVAATTLRVVSSRPPAVRDVEGRWLRELHPAAELLEAARPGCAVELALGPERPEPRYDAVATDRGGRVLGAWRLEPPIAALPQADVGEAWGTTGGVRLRAGGAILAEATVPTDADAFWRWFAGEVLPEVVATLDPAAVPACHELAIVARLSEPDDRLPLDHETDSVVESLHEDLYFGVSEAIAHARGVARPHTLSSGRVLPFVHAAPGAETRAHVLLRAWGSDRVGVRTTAGGFVPAPPCSAEIVVAAVEGRGAAPTALVLDALASDAAASDVEDALRRLTWAAAHRPGLFPSGLALRWRGAVAGPFPAPAATEPLPPRPLHPWEATEHARALAARHPALRCALPRESGLGQPLPVLEVGAPAGPAVSRARRAAWKPTLLLSARQHANEATSTQAAFAWLERLLADGDLLRRANLVVHPLENPDGARLHAALRALAPHHMHHAARYTAFGADLQVDPRVRGAVVPESLLRRDAARAWNPVLHLNDHGYPAHGWVRAQTGHLPRGFGDWSLPVGQMTILITHVGDPAEAAALREAIEGDVAAALLADGDIAHRTRAQLRRSGRYRPAAATPFTFRSGLPFWSSHRPPAPTEGAAAAVAPAAEEPSGPALAPRFTLVTEVPDETVDGAAWDACVRGHALVNEAVARRFLDGMPSPT